MWDVGFIVGKLHVLHKIIGEQIAGHVSTRTFFLYIYFTLIRSFISRFDNMRDKLQPTVSSLGETAMCFF